MKELHSALAARRDEGLYRTRRTLSGAQKPSQVIDGQPVLAFCSNDYLGLANHPDVAKAFHQGINQYGTGAGSAHLVNGHTQAHEALELALAEFTGRPRALLFSTGYMANLGIMSALAKRGDQLFEDKLNHASLLDAGLLSRARFKRYAHADVSALSEMMPADAAGDSFILTDGVFSMDGDVAPLVELSEIAKEKDACLIVDDAHGLGVLGESGGGCCQQLGLGVDEVPVLMGTLGKAIGTFGAFVAGSEDLIETLIQYARTYIYTTAPPPAVAVATLESLKIAKRDHWRREHLSDLVGRFRVGAQAMGALLTDACGPIQPIIVGDAERAVRWSEALLAKGLLVTAIRPPTVPDGQSRLRVTLSASHSEADVDRLLDALEAVVADG